MRFTDLSEEKKEVARIMAQEDFYFFARYMFLARRNFNWLQNWHHKAITDALDRVYKGEIKRLIINIPPRYSKTELAVINWMAWCLGKNPRANFIHTSYSAMLAHKNSGETRELVKHEEFRNIFPDFELSQSSDAKNEWRTALGGGVYATGSGGSITGFGAGGFGDGFNGAIIIDDPHKPDEVFSDVIRQGVIDWFQNTLASRTNSPETPIILIMQRLHEEDLAGWLEDGGNREKWELLSIPVLDENENPLWPEKHSKEKLLQMRAANSYVFSSQYMQRPSPKGGDIIKGAWFREYEVLPRLKRLAIFSDTASKTKEYNDYSVLLVAGLSHEGQVYIMDVIRGKWEAPDLEQKMIDVWEKYRPMRAQAIFVEDKASGTSLIQNIQRKKSFPVRPVQVDKDKYTRVMGIAGYLESGFVHLPKVAQWKFDFVDECEKFTANDAHKHDDQVDSLVMCVNEFLSKPQGIKINPNILFGI